MNQNEVSELCNYLSNNPLSLATYYFKLFTNLVPALSHSGGGPQINPMLGLEQTSSRIERIGILPRLLK